jgi:hypothetical protein
MTTSHMQQRGDIVRALTVARRSLKKARADLDAVTQAHDDEPLWATLDATVEDSHQRISRALSSIDRGHKALYRIDPPTLHPQTGAGMPPTSR